MNEAQKTVLDLTSAALFGRTTSVSEGTDWQAVFDECKSQDLVSLLYPLALEHPVPDDVMARWSYERDRYLLNNAKNISGHFSVQKLLDEAGIPSVILKGLASASYYSDCLLRAFGDVDFIVSKNDYTKAAELLENNGYEYKNRHIKHIVFSQNGITYELHRDIVGAPGTSLKDLFDDYFSDLVAFAKTFTYNGSTYIVPSDRHHAVILLVHTAEHLYLTGIGLRHLCDWAVFVDSMPASFFEVQMQPILKKMGLWRFCGILTGLCTEYLGLRKCSWAGEIDPEYTAALIDDILVSGDFGHNHAEAVREDPELDVNDFDMLQPGSFKTLFSLLTRQARTNLPITSRIPILLPIGWIYIAGRYVFRILTGKRTVSGARNLLTRVGTRKDISDEWRLFEPEE